MESETTEGMFPLFMSVFYLFILVYDFLIKISLKHYNCEQICAVSLNVKFIF